MAKRQRPFPPFTFRSQIRIRILSSSPLLFILIVIMMTGQLLQVQRYSVSSFRFLVPTHRSFGSRSRHSASFSTSMSTSIKRRFQVNALSATFSTDSNSKSNQQEATVDQRLRPDQHQNQHVPDLPGLDNWRSHPSINPKLVFPTWLVPSLSLQKLVKEPLLQPFLANRDDHDENNDLSILQNIHPRIKIIQDYSKTHKLLLRRLEPTPAASADHNGDSAHDLLIKCLKAHEVQDGPELAIQLSYKQLSFSYILSQLLLPHHTAPPTAYEQIGHVAHFNLKPQHVPYGKLIGQVLVDTNPAIETVVSKVGQVSGPFRTYQLELLAGPNQTQTTLVEHGLEVELNVATCYWCTRLSGERQVLLNEIQPYQVVADVFCGVGTLCLLANRDKNCTILANDWNPDAIDYFHKNIDTNNLGKEDFSLTCGDTYDYLTDLGLEKDDRHQDTHQHKQQKQHRLPDHVVMNFPLEAPKFLGALRWWPSKKVALHYQEHGLYPRVHVYTFARGDKPSPSQTQPDDQDHQPRRTEEQVAVDQIANELLPEFGGGSIEDPPGKFRQGELDQEYGTEFQTRVVRDVAPGKVVVCVSFSITPLLLRSMQGDYA